MEQTNEESLLSLEGYFYAINEHSDIDIPAVFLDDSSGSEAVLVFSSMETAKKYCYLARPQAINSIYQLTRKNVANPDGTKTMFQAGLIRIARAIKKHNLDQIKHFVLDHPGTIGAAKYIEVEAIANYGRRPVPKEVSTLEALEKFIEEEMED